MINSANKANFETLKRAFAAGHVALMECTDSASGQLVDAICMVNVRDRTYDLVPVALMPRDATLYDKLTPPAEMDRGYQDAT